MARLFEFLTKAAEGTALFALVASAAWGVLSVILSPCHLASIPLVVAFVSGQGRISAKRAFALSGLFSLGILFTIAIIGVLTALAGRVLGDVGPWANYAVAAVFLAVGLHLLEVIPLPLSSPGQVGVKSKGLLAAFMMGLFFGIALGPCTFAFMAPMLGVALCIAAETPGWAVMLLAAYGLGHCSVIAAAGTSTELVQKYLNWNAASSGAVLTRRVCGVLVILGGLYLLYSA